MESCIIKLGIHKNDLNRKGRLTQARLGFMECNQTFARKVLEAGGYS